MNKKNNRKENDDISKRENRRKFYLPYTNQLEQELVKNISSMDGVCNIRIFNSEYEFKCRYRQNESPELIWYWYINVSLGLYTPLDIVELVNIAYNLYIFYHREETINEMKAIAIKYELGYVGVYYGDADNDKLTKLFISNHHIKNDKFGLTYYYIDYLSQEALSELEMEDDDWDKDN